METSLAFRKVLGKKVTLVLACLEEIGETQTAEVHSSLWFNILVSDNSSLRQMMHILFYKDDIRRRLLHHVRYQFWMERQRLKTDRGYHHFSILTGEQWRLETVRNICGGELWAYSTHSSWVDQEEESKE